MKNPRSIPGQEGMEFIRPLFLHLKRMQWSESIKQDTHIILKQD